MYVVSLETFLRIERGRSAVFMKCLIENIELFLDFIFGFVLSKKNTSLATLECVLLFGSRLKI
jgi:hypothetical protein